MFYNFKSQVKNLLMYTVAKDLPISTPKLDITAAVTLYVVDSNCLVYFEFYASLIYSRTPQKLTNLCRPSSSSTLPLTLGNVDTILS